MGNLSGDYHEQNSKEKVTRLPSVTYARYLGSSVNTLGSHLNQTKKFFFLGGGGGGGA